MKPIDDATPVGPRDRRAFWGRLAAPLGVVVGCAVYVALSRFFAVPVEVWNGPETFTQPAWMANVALVPAVSGFVAGIIAGQHGKWYGMFPVTLVHTADYFTLSHRAAPDVHVLGPGLFVFFMLVMMELALMAGWGAEVLRNRLAGKDVRA